MTTQEQDKMCHTSIHTLATESSAPQTDQVFFECFTFADSGAEVCGSGRTLHLECGGKSYEVTVGEYDSQAAQSPVELRVAKKDGDSTTYHL